MTLDEQISYLNDLINERNGRDESIVALTEIYESLCRLRGLEK